MLHQTFACADTFVENNTSLFCNQDEEDEEDLYTEDNFDSLETDKDPMLVKHKGRKKPNVLAKVSHHVYRAFDEACKDINRTTDAIDITQNVHKVPSFNLPVWLFPFQ